VTARRRFIAYLVALHVVFAAMGAVLVWGSLFWLIPLEMAFVLSLTLSIVLTRAMFRDAAFATAGLQLLRDHDFTTRFREIGHADIDALLALYNQLADNLRDERTRLQEQHHLLSHILRVSPWAIVILDFDGRIVTVSPSAELLLGPAATLLGRTPSSIGSALGEALDSVAPGDTRIVPLAGARRVRCHRGRFIDRGFPRDFLLLEELTDELRRAERTAYEKLIRVMAHEVNNSVTASNSLLHSSLTYGAELPATSRADFEGALGIVIERTEQLNQFMRGFADVFRLPAPTTRHQPILPLLERAVRLVAARPDANGIDWRWDIEGRDAAAEIDDVQMEQVLINVLHNAVDAIGGSGSVTVRTVHRDGGLTVDIDDSGSGIAGEAQANLFTPFFSTKPNGQGIGLTLVREILGAHGFSHSLERVGDRTRFTITIR
jgi:two-component system, NtrC family, nitrogen regulation sensor histidine kinase NtrY